MSSAAHVHVWDTETEEFSTFTPDPQLDEPWVIHECCELGCHALKIERPIFRRGRMTVVYEAVCDCHWQEPYGWVIAMGCPLHD